MHYIYKITNITNGKIYIGQSNKEKERWRQHKYFARQDKPIQYVHCVMKKYGIDNFNYEVIAQCLFQDDADYLEEKIIQQYDSRNKDKGYNISPGGSHAWNAGLPVEQQPMYGKKQSDYQKQRMSEIHSGKIVIHSKETRQKISEAGRGKPKSDEWKKKHSGENHHSAKLTKEIADTIRKRFSAGERKAALAREYCVTKQAIHNIIIGKVWK